MKKIQTTRIVQERGQVTIPQAIRKIAAWAAPALPVTISLDDPEHISIQPHKQDVDWDDLWEKMERVQSFKPGKGGRGNLSEFVFEDRKRH